MKREIIKLPLQSFCFGVRNAINETNRILNNHRTIKPLYMLGEIVHNKYVSSYFEQQGIIVLKKGSRLQMLDHINDGSVIFTAHGVSYMVIDKAIDKKLPYYNTTCPLVKNSIKVIDKYLRLGYEILYIGSSSHPESETALSMSPSVHLIENMNSIDNLNINSDKIIVTNQTTMSIYDIEEIVIKLKDKYPHLLIMEKVCNASKERQEMIMAVAKKHENDPLTAFIVIGDINSHNSKKLADIIQKYNTNVFFVETIVDLTKYDLSHFSTIYLASGTSTPLCIVDEIYDALTNNKEITKSSLEIEDYVK